MQEITRDPNVHGELYPTHKHNVTCELVYLFSARHFHKTAPPPEDNDCPIFVGYSYPSKMSIEKVLEFEHLAAQAELAFQHGQVDIANALTKQALALLKPFGKLDGVFTEGIGRF